MKKEVILGILVTLSFAGKTWPMEQREQKEEKEAALIFNFYQKLGLSEQPWSEEFRAKLNTKYANLMNILQSQREEVVKTKGEPYFRQEENALQIAYRVLSSPQKKAFYDKGLRETTKSKNIVLTQNQINEIKNIINIIRNAIKVKNIISFNFLPDYTAKMLYKNLADSLDSLENNMVSEQSTTDIKKYMRILTYANDLLSDNDQKKVQIFLKSLRHSLQSVE